MEQPFADAVFHKLAMALAFTLFCPDCFLSAQASSLPVPAGEYAVSIRYFSLHRGFAVPKADLISLRSLEQEDCKSGDADNYYRQLPVIEVSPVAGALTGKQAYFFPGVLAERTLKDWHLTEQALSSVQTLNIPRTYDLPVPVELRGTILFLPGLGSSPQFYLTIATALASHGYRVLIGGHPGISGDAYTSDNCLLPGIDQEQLMRKIQNSKLIDPVMNASIKVLLKDIDVLVKYIHSADTSKQPLPLFAMGHSIGGIAANMYCSQKRGPCAAAVNLDGGEYPLFPRQSWPSRRDLPYLKFRSTENIARDRIPKDIAGPRQCVFDFDGKDGKVLHQSFTDIGFFKGIPSEEMPLADLRSKTARVILSFLKKAAAPDDGAADASVSWCGGLSK
ncbi:MAG: alpha/beta hydrolase [Elusimicrobia bacterium]|nr:alpha/beta hydrolase [Elusimicrobiota bacterium]